MLRFITIFGAVFVATFVWAGFRPAVSLAEYPPGPRGENPVTFRVAAIQAPSEFGKPAVNRDRFTTLVRKAAKGGAAIVVLPETAITGYMPYDIKTTWQAGNAKLSDGLVGRDPSDVAETVPGPSTQHFAPIAKELGIYLTVPLLEIDRKTGRFYNTSVLLDPEGRIAIHYRKRNPWLWAERGWASEGTVGNPVIDTPYGRLGLLICFDIHQQAPIMADLKVDTLLYSIAWVENEGSDWFEKRLPEISKRSDMNIVGANWSIPAAEGRRATWHGYGQSRVIARDGKILAKADTLVDETIVYADLPFPAPAKRENVARSNPKATPVTTAARGESR